MDLEAHEQDANRYPGAHGWFLTTQGPMDVVFNPLRYIYHLEEVASVSNGLKICPQLDSRVGVDLEAHEQDANRWVR